MPSGLRMDIQGIRALAILLVVFAHSGVPGFGGGFVGIDVFFVLSGFLITGLLFREIEKRGKISLGSFYARRARRLLPAAAIVLVLTSVAALLIFSLDEQIEVGRQVFGAAFYFVNWIFAFEQVDYFSQYDAFISPIQHFWSLSVEEQFYFIWPLMMTTAAGIAFRSGRPTRRTILMALVPIAVLSLAYSIYLTPTSPEMAYFSTGTRLWELAFGAILAMILPRSLTISRLLSTVFIVGGFAAVMIAATQFGETSSVPGYLALLPVLGTMAILVGGTAQARTFAAGVLCLRPFQWIGDISYSWYLWHWPAIIFPLYIWPDMAWTTVLAICVASLVPAWIAHVLVENPVRRSQVLRAWPKRALVLGAVCSITAAGAGAVLAAQNSPIKVVPVEDVLGARVIPRPGQVPFQKVVTEIAPDPLDAKTDKGQLFDDGCLVYGDVVTMGECAYGDVNSDETIVLFGDSKAMQWFPAINPVAKQRDWRLLGLTRGDCPVATVDLTEDCSTWRENMIERIIEEQPKLILIGAATRSTYRVEENGVKLSRRASEPLLVDGMVKTINRLRRETGATIIMIRDKSLGPSDTDSCVLENPKQLAKCAFAPYDREPRAFEGKAARKAGIRQVDPQKMLCTEKICPPVIGNVLVYRDSGHVTATYSETMAFWFRRILEQYK
jgi:peptidoglycan/LPS O-acetylase OafA/YrhL